MAQSAFWAGTASLEEEAWEGSGRGAEGDRGGMPLTHVKMEKIITDGNQAGAPSEGKVHIRGDGRLFRRKQRGFGPQGEKQIRHDT